MPTISVIVPTRNRAELWRSGRLLASLRAQDDQPDELVIAIDHTEDDTLDAIRTDTSRNRLSFPVRIIEVTKPRPEPFPASGFPDNCLFHAAKGDVTLHIDDDIALPPGYCRHTRAMFEGLPRAVIWGLLRFVDDQDNELADVSDCRRQHAAKHNWPLGPGGLWLMPTQSQTHWGAVYASTLRDIRAIGGHNIEHCGYHNSDTRLGNRLARFCGQSFATSTPATTCSHLGLTWYSSHKHDKKAIRGSRFTSSSSKIANGGADFWTSTWFDDAYRVTLEIS